MLLPTKLAPPTSRQRRVPRRRLVERIESTPVGALTLIAAPAGFGKTSLLAEWHASARDALPIAWVSLDENDSDPARFWSYVVAALQTVQPGLGAGLLASLRDRAPTAPETLLAGLIRDLSALPGRVALVLDDYQAVETPAIHAALGFLLDYLPPTLQLVISTRADPPLPLARLRARGQLVEVRTADLRLTADEATAFLTETMGLSLADETAMVLVARSEGWAAGLQLAALATQDRADPDAFVRAFAGSHRFVLDYLVAEVLSRLPEGLQAFLLRSAVLTRLCGPLCDALLDEEPSEPGDDVVLSTGATPDSQSVLEELERTNLFLVPLDDERHWYRYHHLFAEALRHRLRQEAPGLIPELHRRASTWYAEAGLSAEGVEHALLGRDWELAVRQIRPLSRPLFEQGLHATLQRWISTLPEEVRRALPAFNFGHGLSLLLLGEVEKLEALLDAAETELAARDNLPALGEVYVLRASLAGSRLQAARATTFADAALELLPVDDVDAPRASAFLVLSQARTQCGDLDGAQAALAEGLALCEQQRRQVSTWLALNISGTLEVLRGKLHRGAECYQNALARIGDRPVFPRIGALAMLGGIYREWDQPDTASGHLEQAIQLGEQVGLGVYLSHYRIEQARLFGALGEHEQASAALDAAEQAARRLGSLALVGQVRAHRAWSLLIRGDLAGAVRWADTEAPAPADLAAFERLPEALILARVRIAQGQPATVASLLAWLLTVAEEAGAMGCVVEILAVQALSQARLGDRAAGLATLERALHLAQPEGYVRLFADEGAPMTALLRELRSRPDLSEYVNRLLRALGTPATLTGPSPLAVHLPEQPTDRELEVLRLVSDGLSNRQIAEQLVIAESTVKAHLHHLGGKLGTTSRTQVLARARELGLL